MSGLAAVERLLRAADLPEGVGVGLADPALPQLPLHAVEEAAVLRAVAGRRAEFAAGRTAARRALAQIGHPEAAIPMAEDRAPVWPEGIIGSLSHTRRACLAVVARKGPFAALGIDLEDDLPLPDDAMFSVGTPEEARPLSPDPRIAARRLFSLKEAAYKAQYPLSRTILDFEALRLTRHCDALVTTRPVPPFARGTRFAVSQWTGGGVVLSFCALDPGLAAAGLNRSAIPQTEREDQP